MFLTNNFIEDLGWEDGSGFSTLVGVTTTLFESMFCIVDTSG